MTFITEIETNESMEHKEAKIKLFELLSKNRVTFVNQFKKEMNITPNHTWDNIYMEACIYSRSDGDDPFKDKLLCSSCFRNTDEFTTRLSDIKKPTKEEYKIASDYCFDNRFNDNEFTQILNTSNDNNNSFKAHPCSICKYKGKLKLVSIFDIGLSLNGKYTVAIEIVKTSNCSMNKIRYCRDNNIPLIEVDCQDILDFKDGDAPLFCRSLWWFERYTKDTMRKCTYVQ